MKYIKKYIKFFETVSVAPETKKVLQSDNLSLKHKGVESTDLEVVERFSKLFIDLSNDEKSEINSYFK